MSSHCCPMLFCAWGNFFCIVLDIVAQMPYNSENKEAYRSGHNEPHSKCGCPQGHESSNLSASASGESPQTIRAFTFVGA